MKSIIGFEGLYSIREDGTIISHPKWKGTHMSKEKIVTSYVDKDGYLNIRLYKDKKAHTKKVHRLIAEHFIDKDKTHLEVNHINGIKNDNRIENLEWCSGLENKLHSIQTGLRKAKLNIDDKFKICQLYASGMSKVALGKAFGVSDVTIGTFLKGVNNG
jgi:hypothetical protein